MKTAVASVPPSRSGKRGAQVGISSPASQNRACWGPWLAGLLILLLAAAGCHRSPSRIVIGSKNFTEQAILGELLAQYLEDRGFPVERRFYLAGTYVCHQALLAGRIDLYVEYTGTALTAILKQPPIREHAAAYDRVRDAYARQFGLTLTEPLGFNNTFALVVRGSDAQRLHLQAISDLVPYAPAWRAGFGYEFMERRDGFPGLVATYGLHFGPAPRTMDLGLLYRALVSGQADVVAGSATDGQIPALGLSVLEDNKHYFPPYDAVPIVGSRALRDFPQLRTALSRLGGRIQETEMRQMNYAVDAQRRDPKQVVREFLQRKKLAGG